jgi:hypothetical protein
MFFPHVIIIAGSIYILAGILGAVNGRAIKNILGTGPLIKYSS